MKIEPLGARVLVKDIEDADRTKGGIIIPEQYRDRSMQGIVQAVGPGELTLAGEMIPMTVNIGDRIMFGKMAGHEIKVDGQAFRLMKLTEIMCRVMD